MKVLLDKNYHNRELGILKKLRQTAGILNLESYCKADVDSFRKCIKYLKDSSPAQVDSGKLASLDPSETNQEGRKEVDFRRRSQTDV